MKIKLEIGSKVSASYLEYGGGDREECEMASIPIPTKPDVYRIEVLDLALLQDLGPIFFRTMFDVEFSTPLSSQRTCPFSFRKPFNSE